MLDETKIYVVVGATGEVGSTLAADLEARGHVVRRVARSLGVSFDDPARLHAAFSGANGAYLMIPFDRQAPDLHAREIEIGAQIAEAVQAAGLRRVVLLSGLSAHMRKGSSLGAALMEERLDRLGIPELAHLRAGFFMENFTKGMGFAAQAAGGSFSTPFRGDLPMPLIAARDVGHKAAELMTSDHFPTDPVQELHGSGNHTLAEATATLGAAIGKPDVLYRQVEYAQARQAMVAGGFSASFADAVMETAESFNAGERWALEERAPRNTTPTSLREWAEETLAAT
jgi:uncharacterized protein YbjT (DUF2867 family)